MINNSINSLVPRLYDAVGNPGEWQSILDEVAELSGFRGATIFSGDEVQVSSIMFFSVRSSLRIWLTT